MNALLPAEVAARIAAYLQNPEPDDFSAVAREIFAFQYEHNAPFRRFCDGRGVTPDGIRTWQDIPAAPAVAFKRFALTCAPEEECTPERGGRIFHSSGTTGAETSRHFMDATALNLYRLSLQSGYSQFVLPDGARLPVLALMAPPGNLSPPAPLPCGAREGGATGGVALPTPVSPTVSTPPSLAPQGRGAGGERSPIAPHSSLSFMLGELIGEYGGAFFIEEGWQERLATTLRELQGPVAVFGTAFAWVHFFDSVSERFSLPSGSRVVETGGFKGRSREVERDELYALFTERLGVPATHCLSEYGMSEMASQFYDSTLYDHVHGIVRPARKVAPPWLRTRIMDPVTGQEARAGEAGLLAHYDLANLNSVLAIQTEDMGIVAEDGDGFYLLGRAPGAVLRGCSLTAEELMTRRA